MKNTVATFAKMKANGEKISMLTCYDYSTAKLEEAAGINAILVGDSLGNVMLGLPDTLSVTMEDMITYGRSVARACHNTMVVIDMPFMSYQVSIEQALTNAGRLMKEGRGGAVKLEGGATVCPQIKAMTEAGIPVMAQRFAIFRVALFAFRPAGAGGCAKACSAVLIRLKINRKIRAGVDKRFIKD